MKFILLPLLIAASAHAAVVISEFEPNPAGGDPADTTFELAGGTPQASFDFWILSIENDGFDGTIDRAGNVTGSFDANGLAVVTTTDLENPSFTVLLIESTAPIVTGGDIDPNDDGNLVIPAEWTILDAVGVSDATGDDSTLYGAALGGTDILFNGEFEPLLVFRDSSSGDWFQTVTADFGGPDERIATFPADASVELSGADFIGDPEAPSFGSINPTFVPEPSAALLGFLSLLTFLRRKR